jgi:c-di-GMP-binding flagellar brake protein YcgR
LTKGYNILLKEERREYTRVKFRREVYLTFPDGESRVSTSEDFSMYGMGILTDSQLDKDQSLLLDFKILSKDDWRDVNLRGRVVYSSAEGDHFKTGISFY